MISFIESLTVIAAERRNMKVLVISNTPWANDNSFGNSYSNIFEGIPDLEFANIYCRYGQPDNAFNMRFFQITEKSLIKNLKDSSIPSGFQVFPQKKPGAELKDMEQKGFDQARKMRWQIMFWGRNLVWKAGRWKSPQLKKFLDDFQPDLIFQPVYVKPYINEIVLFIKEYTGVPMVGYISDDNYTLKQYRFSPLYWLDRFYNRRKVKQVIEKCEILYVISEIQKQEYQKIFTPPCKVLTKCADFSQPCPVYPVPQNGVKLIYAGNIGMERWKSLGLIADAVERLHKEGYEIQFDLYTATPMTSSMQTALHKEGTQIHAPISYAEIVALQKQSDVVIHAEGLSRKSRMEVHQSFSTKLVDYFAFGKCIFAIGTEDEASVKHLLDHDAAIVASSKEEVYEKLKSLVLQPSLIAEYGKKAYRCGQLHHDKKDIQKMLQDDMQMVVQNSGENAL